MNFNKLLDIEKVYPEQLRFVYKLIDVTYDKSSSRLEIKNKINPLLSRKYWTLAKNDYKRFKCELAKQVVMNLIYDYITKPDRFNDYEVLCKLKQIFIGVSNSSKQNQTVRYVIYLADTPYYINNDDISRFKFEDLFFTLVLIVNRHKVIHG